VFAWGWNIAGQLGNGTTNGSDLPVKVSLPGGTKVTAIAAGFAHSVALTSTGALLAWGKNYNGNLGDGSTTDSDVPVKVSLPVGTKATAVAAGAEHNLAVTSTGAVLAWGYNADGQLGDGGTGAITAGDFPVVSGSTTSGVPNFGTLVFSSALINGYPFGAAGTGLQADDPYATSTGPLQIKTVFSASSPEAFTSVTPDSAIRGCRLRRGREPFALRCAQDPRRRTAGWSPRKTTFSPSPFCPGRLASRAPDVAVLTGFVSYLLVDAAASTSPSLSGEMERAPNDPGELGPDRLLHPGSC